MKKFRYVKGQQKQIEKKTRDLDRKTAYFIQEGEIEKLEEKYNILLETQKKTSKTKKKNKKPLLIKRSDLLNETRLKAYREALKIEKNKLRKI